ncbi:MAG TPA: hypothetical protein VIK63_05615 [Haloplasmataceae bacterium]
MRAITFFLLGVAGTLAFQRYTADRPKFQKELRRFLQNNGKSLQRLRALM